MKEAAGRRNGGMMHRGNAGATLVELLVALAIIALIAGLSSVAVGSLRPPPGTGVRDSLRAFRARAIQDGAPITASIGATVIRFLPDGRVLGGPVDPLTGAWDEGR